jgi:ketosteroid isomerase-like protein
MHKVEENIQVVKQNFEAFSKGNIQGALNTFAENVELKQG